MKWTELIGLKIVGFRGVPQKKRFGNGTEVPLTFILCEDKKSYIELREQDQYDYHDCNPYARCLELRQDEKLWGRLFNNEGFAESTEPVDFF